MLLRSTLIYAPAILLTRISALLLLVIVTRLIDQTEYGLLTLVVTVGEMTDIAVTNWLRIALLRLGGKGDVSRGSLILAGRVLLASTALALIVSVVASALIVPERWVEFSIAVGSYLIAGAVGRFALTVLQMQQRHSVYSMLEFLRAVLQLALPIGAIVLFQDSFLTVSLGTSLGVLIAGIMAGIMASRRVVAGPPRFTQREFFALGVPLIIMALVGFGLNSAERLFLKVYYDAGAVAIFAAAYALARQPIDMVANAINMGAFPEVVSRFDEEGSAASGRLLSQLMALMIRLCLPVAAMLVALSSDITQLLLPSAYHGRVGLLFPIIAFSVLCGNLTSFVYGTVVHAHKRPWLLIIATSFGSVATIALSVLLIPPMAEVGAALALAGGSLVGFVACVVISERLTPVPVPWRDIGVSVVISFTTGLAARLASALLGDVPAVFSLVVGGVAGAVVFFGLTWLFHPTATMQFVGKLRARLRTA
ncbi:polysaccharide biosynthesis C-terminal domain-containing protein [Mesorhizobium sp. YC-39]|uniref:lipopolysaccharide biosynthesis protein n=1 Tax=unclassified Mesorhizobium TaxID=325217 RepID=UPI0021E95CCC|nr:MULTISPECIES: polysaccharide biosynthesis C-terminal domain-containing protein [unclassified Mesorhizobium]MCV3208655.1 polysaccharide biosynthesis C-terminal domain-containing protein [Mesorhizobium sp. YC-2]MCV3231996.1 polysaccharide biosynthesis C-terminal domain-containing protein [Mesorhizobium sp. YC-39]